MNHIMKFVLISRFFSYNFQKKIFFRNLICNFPMLSTHEYLFLDHSNNFLFFIIFESSYFLFEIHDLNYFKKISVFYRAKIFNLDGYLV